MPLTAPPTKAAIGLGSVDNTADTAKPVSTAQQTALDLKRDIQSIPRYDVTFGVLSAASTTSSSYVNMTGTPTTLSFVKLLPANVTYLRMSLSVVISVTVAAAVARFGLSVNALDTDVMQLSFTSVGVPLQAVGEVKYGIPAGAVNMVARWMRVSGTGTLGTDANSWMTLSCMEIYI